MTELVIKERLVKCPIGITDQRHISFCKKCEDFNKFDFYCLDHESYEFYVICNYDKFLLLKDKVRKILYKDLNIELSDIQLQERFDKIIKLVKEEEK